MIRLDFDEDHFETLLEDIEYAEDTLIKLETLFIYLEKQNYFPERDVNTARGRLQSLKDDLKGYYEQI